MSEKVKYDPILGRLRTAESVSSIDGLESSLNAIMQDAATHNVIYGVVPGQSHKSVSTPVCKIQTGQNTDGWTLDEQKTPSVQKVKYLTYSSKRGNTDWENDAVTDTKAATLNVYTDSDGKIWQRLVFNTQEENQKDKVRYGQVVEEDFVWEEWYEEANIIADHSKYIKDRRQYVRFKRIPGQETGELATLQITNVSGLLNFDRASKDIVVPIDVIEDDYSDEELFANSGQLLGYFNTAIGIQYQKGILFGNGENLAGASQTICIYGREKADIDYPEDYKRCKLTKGEYFVKYFRRIYRSVQIGTSLQTTYQWSDFEEIEAPLGIGKPMPIFDTEDTENNTHILKVSYDDGDTWEELMTISDGQDGQDGAAGNDGINGQDGAAGNNGSDGITPQLTVINEEDGSHIIKVSYDNGTTWETLTTVYDGQNGQNGQDANAIEGSVTGQFDPSDNSFSLISFLGTNPTLFQSTFFKANVFNAATTSNGDVSAKSIEFYLQMNIDGTDYPFIRTSAITRIGYNAILGQTLADTLLNVYIAIEVPSLKNLQPTLWRTQFQLTFAEYNQIQSAQDPETELNNILETKTLSATFTAIS